MRSAGSTAIGERDRDGFSISASEHCVYELHLSSKWTNVNKEGTIRSTAAT